MNSRIQEVKEDGGGRSARVPDSLTPDFLGFLEF